MDSTAKTIVSDKVAALSLEVEQEVERLTGFLRRGVQHDLHRRGAVVGCSGGIDSSVVLALCARAFGPEQVVALLMPERESSPESATLAGELAAQFGVPVVTEDLTEALEGAGCYRRRDEAVRRVFPEFKTGWKSKIVLPGSLLEQETLSVFYLAVIDPDGHEHRRRLPAPEYAQIVAASNFKQRLRMATLYYHAELRHFAVAGTAPKNEHDLGFFVKHGDGGADICPIRHLFKSQVYQLAGYLGIPQSIRERTPTTDTYSAGSTQEEFFFRVPYSVLDRVWAGFELGLSAAVMAPAFGLTVEQVERVTTDLVRKQRTTSYLRATALALDGQAPRP
jgi:NAD+ synthase